MKNLKYLALVVLTLAMVSCGDDEPGGSYTREFSMIYPEFAAGHKLITKIEKIQDNGASAVVTVDYDGDHVKRINAVYRDMSGSVSNEETISFDYKNGAIICDKKIKDVTYSFDVNGQGAIVKLSDVSTSRTVSALQYNGSNQIEHAQISSPNSTDVTNSTWEDGKLMQWTFRGVNKNDSTVYVYSSGIPNKGGIDVTSNNPFTFTTLVCEVMRNAGLYGATSAYLPNAVKKDMYIDADTEMEVLKNYSIFYDLDDQGYVKSYTTTESPKYTVKYTYK